MTYCYEVWGLGYANHRKKLVILQKRCIRIICNSTRYEHTNPLFKDLKILKIDDINSYLITIMMFKFYNKELPTVIQDMFKSNSSVHDHFTRQYNDLHPPLAMRNYTQMSFRYMGVKIWNNRPSLLSCNCTINTFKNNLKKIIINSY